MRPAISLLLFVALSGPFASRLRGQETNVVYDLLEGARLGHTHWDSEGNVEHSAVELSGSFRAALHEWSYGDLIFGLSDIDFRSITEPEYTVSGSGSCRVSFFGSCRSGLLFCALTLKVNEIEEVSLTTELAGLRGPFPVFRSGFFTMLEPGQQDSFGMFLVAAPRPEYMQRFFQRGDVTGDGKRNITDAVAVLEYLYRRGTEPTCLDAVDADDDGTVNLSDVVYLLSYLFRDGSPLAAPQCPCSLDRTEDELGCNGQAYCAGE